MNTNKLSKLASLALVSVSLTLAACSGHNVESRTASSEEATTRASIAPSARGPARWLTQALSEVSLRQDQRSEIEKMVKEAESRHASVMAARKDLTLAVATQVETGKIDRAELNPKIDAIKDAWSKVRPSDKSALERLHALLTPEQRTAFVNAMEAKMEEHKGEHKGAHKEGHKGAHKGEHRGHGMMMKWADDLKLSADQQHQIKEAIREKFKEMHHEHGKDHKHASHHEGQGGKKFLEAFKGDRFVMDEVFPHHETHKVAQQMGDRLLDMAEMMLPILTKDQRSLLAQKIREKAEHFEGHGF